MKLTVFTAPKPFEGHVGVIQRNAIRSWQLLDRDCEVILFGNEAGTAEVARELSLRHVPDVARNEYGTPRLDDLFAQAEQQSQHSLLCYANSDIILLHDFSRAVDGLATRLSKFVMIGRRFDLDVEGPLSFAAGWDDQLRRDVQQRGQRHSPQGIDYFVFPRGAFGEIPPFAIGRTVWDHWLIYRALCRGHRVVDASGVVKAVHQNHDYAHHGEGRAGIWDGAEAQQNRELAGRWPRVYDVRDANWVLTRFGLMPALTPMRIYRRLAHWLLCGMWSRES
ncbi:MAG: hypothetical protein WD648_13450 [Planctomycetaceae bacterium]